MNYPAPNPVPIRKVKIYRLIAASYDDNYIVYLQGPIVTDQEFKQLCDKNMEKACNAIIKKTKYRLADDEIIDEIAKQIEQDGFFRVPAPTSYIISEYDNKQYLPITAELHNQNATRMYSDFHYSDFAHPPHNAYLIKFYEEGYKKVIYYLQEKVMDPHYKVDAKAINTKYYGKFGKEYARGFFDGIFELYTENKNWLGIFQAIQERIKYDKSCQLTTENYSKP